VVANKNDDTVRILLGSGDGAFTPGQTLSLPAGSAPNFVTIADLDGDGKLDLIVVNEGYNAVTKTFIPSTVSVFLGNGDGRFRPGATFSSGPLAYAAA